MSNFGRARLGRGSGSGIARGSGSSSVVWHAAGTHRFGPDV